MTRSGAGVVAVVAVLCPAAVLLPALTGVGVPAVTLGVVVLGALVVLGVLLGTDELGVLLLLAAVGTTPWNAVVISGVKLAPALLAGATLLLAVPVLTGRAPLRVRPWSVVLGATIAAVAVLTWFLPPDATYFASRYTGEGSVEMPPVDQIGGVSAVEGLVWLVAVVVLPVVVGVACHDRPGLVPRLADAWLVGASVSAAVAVTDEVGLTHLSAAFLPVVDVGGRQAGLSAQPNHVAVAAALTVPVAVWRLTRGSRGMRVLAAVCLAGIAGGLVVSASRGATVGAVLAALAVLLLTPRTRRVVLPLVGAAVLAAVLAVAAVPALLGDTGERLRLVGAGSADASDAERAGIGAQAWQDFLVSPLHGIGLEVAVQGHDIYLQLLASGGALLLLGFLAALVALAVDVRFLLRHADPVVPPGLVTALALAVVTWLVVGAVENHLSDLFLYVPLALLGALRTAPSPSIPPATHEPGPSRAAPTPDALAATAAAGTAEGPRA